MEYIDDEEFCFEPLYEYGIPDGTRIGALRTLMGKTPREYLRLMKMTRSTQRLVNEEDTILEIALQSGSRRIYKSFFRDFLKIPQPI